MSQLWFKDGVADRLVWSRPDSSIAPFCSLCQSHIPDDAVPLMFWDSDGACAQLCDKCAGDSITVKK